MLGQERRAPLAGIRHRAGLTLVEVMFTIALIGFLFIALWGMISTNVSLVSICRDNETATQLLTEKFETIRLYNWVDFNTPGYIKTNFVYPETGTPYFTGAISIVPADVYPANLRQVTIEVKWTGNRRPQSRKMVSYVSEKGLNVYVNYPQN